MTLNNTMTLKSGLEVMLTIC